ncbi:Golgi-to-ER vesicle coat component [Tulasnella sp. 425]|nr:Golgi-to-ER vesicle coat component [Tulasnella sp. 425]
MDDEIQLDDGQNRDEPVRKRVKGEPVDDETAYSTDSSPSANRFNHHIPTRQPSDEMIDVDGIVSEVLVGPSHPGPQNALSHTSFQPQPPPRQQLALGEGKLSLIESINDDFESYLEQQQQKADMLRKKWLTCSMEEWEQGGSEISAKFGSLIERVRDGMKSKLQAFSGIDARMADHTKALDERANYPAFIMFGLRKWPTPVAKPLWPFGVAAALTFYLVSGLQDAAVQSLKLVFFVPRQNTQTVLSTLFVLNPSRSSPASSLPPPSATVGRIGLYDGCAFVFQGTGQFLPSEGANPTVGQVGKPELVEEDPVETLVVGTVEHVREVVKELKKVHPYEEVAYDPNLSLYTTSAFIILDTDGNRVLAKYYNNKNSTIAQDAGCKSLTTLKDQRAYEKSLWEKTKKAGDVVLTFFIPLLAERKGDIILYDSYLVVYRHSLDLIFYLLGPPSENELMLNAALVAYFDALSIQLKNQVEKRSVLDNLDVVLLCLDETIDDGYVYFVALKPLFSSYRVLFAPSASIIVETDSTAIASRLSSRAGSGGQEIVIDEAAIRSAVDTIRNKWGKGLF